jgi:hypothetical protein
LFFPGGCSPKKSISNWVHLPAPLKKTFFSMMGGGGIFDGEQDDKSISHGKTNGAGLL